jgi:hypothetical protein
MFEPLSDALINVTRKVSWVTARQISNKDGAKPADNGII